MFALTRRGYLIFQVCYEEKKSHRSWSGRARYFEYIDGFAFTGLSRSPWYRSQSTLDFILNQNKGDNLFLKKVEMKDMGVVVNSV